jgi:hypothetical protein
LLIDPTSRQARGGPGSRQVFAILPGYSSSDTCDELEQQIVR